jgi:hypothetical protein
VKLWGSCVGSLVDGGAVVGEAFEDLVCGLAPHERGGVLVPMMGPGLDVGGELFLTLRWADRWSFLVVSAENQRSTRFIHEP